MEFIQSLDMVYKVALMGVVVWVLITLLSGIILEVATIFGSYLFALYVNMVFIIIMMICYITWIVALLKIAFIVF